MENDVWFDNHPVLSDVFILTLPGIAITAMWMIFGFPVQTAIIQGFLTSLVFFIGLLYLQKSNKKSVFRSSLLALES